MTSRREALKRLTQVSALGLAAGPLLNSLMAQGIDPASVLDVAGDRLGANAAVKPIGVQLYTVRDQMAKDVEATLAKVASIGYKEVEFAGYFNRTPAQISRTLKTNGLTSPSVHIPVGEILKAPTAVLDAMQTIGHKFAVMPYIDAKERTLDHYKRFADQFNEAAALTRKRGIQFAYHNHDFEFETVSGEVPYELLLTRCDRNLVKFEMDLFWMNKARQNPLDYFARYPGRFPLVHAKDMTAAGEMTEVGAGVIPFKTYFAKAKQAGIEHYFVERDNPTDSFASIATSFKALTAL
ncbi:MAG: sugar phosphate isomerase/epimerase [Gemmatimonadota bacterium]